MFDICGNSAIFVQALPIRQGKTRKSSIMTTLERIEDAVAKKSNTLDLSGTGIAEIPAEINNLPWLTDLILWNTEVSDLRPLTKLENLRTLHLPKSVVDVSALSQMVSLRTLDAWNSDATDFTCLDSLVALGLKIHFDAKKVADLLKRQAV